MNQSPRPMSIGMYATFTAAIALAVAVLVVVLARENVPVAPEPTPGIETVADDVLTVPGVPDDLLRDIRSGLDRFFGELYGRAFLAAQAPAATPTPAVSPLDPLHRIERFFTPAALEALRRQSDAFTLPESVDIRHGTVRFGGMTTVVGRTPLEAFLQVEFFATADSPGGTHVVRVRQRGTMLLARTAAGWRIEGFDLKFIARTVAVTPTPSAI